MPNPGGLAAVVASRASRQASANTETHNGAVTKVYTDANGNVTAADVRLTGSTRVSERIPNNSGQKLYNGAPVSINYLRGNRHAPSITGGSGSSSSAALAANSTDQSQPTSSTAPDLTAIPLLLEAADPAAPDGYVLGNGANITLASTDPAPPTGGGPDSGGALVISAAPLVLSALPDPATTTLPDGTCVDLMDGGGNPIGMYRLDATAHAWRRRDAAAVAGSGLTWGSTWNSGTTYATGVVVKYLGAIYISLVSGNTGNDPTTSPTDWEIWISANIDSGLVT